MREERKYLRSKLHEKLMTFYKEYGYNLDSENGVISNGDFEVHWGVK